MKKFLATILSIILILTIIPMAYAEETNTYKVGDIIQFGSYPQSEVKDETLVAELNALAPEWDEWISYGYYSGNGEVGSMVQGDWMRYIDVEFEGEKYRGVKFTQYRPVCTYYVSSYYSYQQENEYCVGDIYWFKYETIDWVITDLENGEIVSKSLIDAQAYNNTKYLNFNDDTCFKDIEYNYYAANYEHSSIRNWLNTEFLSLAFTETSKNEIATTKIYNPAPAEEFASSTYDKIYLLSVADAEKYGYLPLDYSSGETSIGVETTDYTKCIGGRNDEYWLTRSASNQSGFSSYIFRDRSFIIGIDNIANVRPVLKFGDSSKIHRCLYERSYFKDSKCQTGKEVYSCNCGATYSKIFEADHNYVLEKSVEATHLAEGKKVYICSLCKDSYTESLPKLQNHIYNEVVTVPTCKNQGYTTYTCACGDTYVDNYVEPTDHKDDNADNKCDYCSVTLEEPEEKNFFEKIIDFFKNIFDKLFGWLR